MYMYKHEIIHIILPRASFKTQVVAAAMPEEELKRYKMVSTKKTLFAYSY